MTVQRTRELLGEKVAHLSDEQLLEFINQTDKLLDVLIKMAFASSTGLHNNKKHDIP